MSAHKSIDAVQIELHHPSLEEMDDEPLLQALARGELPTNHQINDSIDRMRSSIEQTKEKAHLNDKGERLVHDAGAILDTAQRIINERNDGDSIQHLLKDSRDVVKDASYEAAKQARALGKDIQHSLPHIPSKTELVLGAIPAATNALSHLPNISSLNLTDLKSLINSISENVEFNFPTEEIKQIGGDAKDAYNLLREIVLYAARSKEFRDLLGEMGDFFHGAFGDVSEKLSEIGESVKMDIDSKDATLSNTRDVAMKDGKEIVAAAKDSHPIDMTNEARKEAYEKFAKLIRKISDKPEYKKLADLWWKYIDEIREKMDDVASKAAEKASELKDKAAEKAEQIKDKAEQLEEKAKEKAGDLADMAAEKVGEIKDHAKETAAALKDDAAFRGRKVYDKNADSFDRVWNDVRDVVDNFGGKGTFDSFYMQTYNFYARLYNDKAARRYLLDLRSFSTKAIHDPKLLTSKSDEGMQLVTRGRQLVQGQRYRTLYNRYFRSWNKLIHNFSDDNLVNDFRQQLRSFAADFALDSKGRPDIYAITESLGQIKTFIYPIMMKQLENMTVAKIVGASDGYDWSIDHLTVGIANFVPESFDLRTKNHLKMNVKDMEAEQNNTRIVLDIKKLKPHFNDVKFWYRRKSFPHIEDAGTVDVDLSAGEGTRIKVIWKIKSKHNRPYAFSLMEVKCVVDKIDIKIKEAKHDVLDKIAASVFVGSIKNEIANGIVNAIVDVLHPLNDTMNKWFATRPIGHVYDKINEKVHESFDEAVKKSNQFMKSHPIDRLGDAIMEEAEDVKYNVGRKVDLLMDEGRMAVDAAEALKDSASALKRKAEKTLSEENPGLREIKDTIKEKGSELKIKGVELRDEAMEKGSEIIEKVKENMPTDLEDAKKKAVQLKDAAVEKGTEVLEAAKEKYPDAAKKAEQLKDAAMEKGTELKGRAGELKDAAVEKGSELASKAKENMPADLEDAKKKAGQLKDAAVEKGSELKDKAVEKGSEALEAAKEKYPEAAKKAEQLKEKAGELKDKAVEKGSEAIEAAKEKYPEAAKKAEQLKDAATEKGSELMMKGVELKDDALEKGSEIKEKAKENMPTDLEDAKKKAGQLKDAAVEKGTELKDKALEKGSELKEKATEKGAEAAKKAGELKDAAVEKGTEVAKKAGEKAGDLKDAAVEKGTELKEKATEKGADVAKKAEKLKDAAVEKGTELKDKAVEKGSEVAQKAKEVEESAEVKAIEVKDAARGAASYAAVASGDSQPIAERTRAKEAQKDNAKWHSTWVKPSKTAKAQKVQKESSAKKDKDVVMEEKIAANPFEALSEENLPKNKKAF